MNFPKFNAISGDVFDVDLLLLKNEPSVLFVEKDPVFEIQKDKEDWGYFRVKGDWAYKTGFT